MSMHQPPIDFDALSKGIYSQGAEEDVLERIFERIEPATRFCAWATTRRC